MRLSFKYISPFAAVLFAACETLPTDFSSHTKERLVSEQSFDAELINRSEVVAIVSSVDVATDLEQKAAHWGYDLKRKEVLAGLGMYLLTFDCPPGIDPYDASLELEKLQPQSTVEVNHKYTVQADIRITQSRHMNQALRYADELIEWPKDGCEAWTSIGIIDGMVDVNLINEGYASQIIRKDFLDDGDQNMTSLHGTAIADILTATGRINNAVIYNASVIRKDANGVQYSGLEPMLKALDWMVRNDVRVVNISLAGPYNRTLDRGIRKAASKGVVIVAAVGNDGAAAAPRYPAAFPDVIAATAIDSNMNIYEKAVRGKHVDVSAPGVEIYVGGETSGRYVSGTSIAAPFVTAKIASDKNYEDIYSVSKIREHLRNESLDLGEEGPDSIYGAGLIKARSCKM